MELAAVNQAILSLTGQTTNISKIKMEAAAAAAEQQQQQQLQTQLSKESSCSVET